MRWNKGHYYGGADVPNVRGNPLAPLLKSRSLVGRDDSAHQQQCQRPKPTQGDNVARPHCFCIHFISRKISSFQNRRIVVQYNKTALSEVARLYIRSLKECKYSLGIKPRNWQDFELLVRDCATIELKEDFRLFGRSGQEQYGIDIYSPKFKTVIQCKDCRNARRLKAEVENDYVKATTHFQKKGQTMIEKYIIATTLDTDAALQEELEDLGFEKTESFVEDEGVEKQRPTVEVWFWEQICEIIDNYIIHNDGDAFADGFEDTLFLHKKKTGCENVCLKNLFVFQAYRELDRRTGKPGNLLDDLKERLKRFFYGKGKMERLLLVEGDAGSGKSTLVAWLNYVARTESRQRTEPFEVGTDYNSSSDAGILNGRPLITVRLRELINTLHNETGLGDAILKHMNLPDIFTLKALFPRAIFVLDGFDELCMVKELEDYEYLIRQFCGWIPEESRVLITSRPRYIYAEEIGIGYAQLILDHFSPEKRGQWLDSYLTLFPRDKKPIDPRLEEYLRSAQDDGISNLCDTPLTLYLLASSGVPFEFTNNLWALYHHIFSEANVNAEYATQMGAGSCYHPMGNIVGALLYQITEEIAYTMYCANGNNIDDRIIKTGDDSFVVTECGVIQIINNLMQQEHFRKKAMKVGKQATDLKRSYALCCYWRANADCGPVEFYHNNIRDFFLCEKIWRIINFIYQKESSDEEKTDELARAVVGLFKFGVLSDTVCRFLRERARRALAGEWENEIQKKENVFPLQEQEHPLLPMLYQKLLLQGRLYDGLDMDEHIPAIEHILHNTALLYRSICDQILGGKNIMRWWIDVDAINRSKMIRYTFGHFIGMIGSQSNFSGADFRGEEMSKSKLFGSNFSGTNMSGAGLSGSDLKGANFSEAVLRGTNLNNSDLRESVLRNADLRWADLSVANLRRADLRGADLRGADLNGADLRWADMEGADLRDADMRWADLRGAKLPSGYQGYTQAAQIEHLRSNYIRGLKYEA